MQWVEFGGIDGNSVDENTNTKSDIKPVSAPSRTYPMRKMIMAIVAPTAVGLAKSSLLLWLPPHLRDDLPTLVFYVALILLLAWIKGKTKKKSSDEEEIMLITAEEGSLNDHTTKQNNNKDDVLINMEDPEENIEQDLIVLEPPTDSSRK